jgi:hypothetical protein
LRLSDDGRFYVRLAVTSKLSSQTTWLKVNALCNLLPLYEQLKKSVTKEDVNFKIANLIENFKHIKDKTKNGFK